MQSGEITFGLKYLPDEPASTDADLFSILRQMHLTGVSNGLAISNKIEIQNLPQESVAGLIVSRKRKAWEGVPSVGSKYFGTGRPPASRGSDEEEAACGGGGSGGGGVGLETPHCSRTGFDDEEGGGESNGADTDTGGGGGGVNGSEADSEHHHHHHHQLPKAHMLSPMNPNLLSVEDIDADNLAADFDGSFTGLGVDINTTNYSMSEAMLSLNNIALSSHHIKQESTGSHRSRLVKSDPAYIFSNYGALDLSNDEAQHPDSEDTPPPSHPHHPPTFSGSVSRDNSQDSLKNRTFDKKMSKSVIELDKSSKPKMEISSPGHFALPGGGQSSGRTVLVYGKGDLEGDHLSSSEDINFASPKLEQLCSVHCTEDETDSRFQYILNAPTSIATKLGEPSLTYINQGQSYELKIKKLGDLSQHYRKKWLRSTVRICFHERRLQYIENEQIAEWARTHPNERILEVDMPLSYGIADIKQEPGNLSMISFSWDPTRDTGVFIKVHCISTEFTPKKHGGERGVPFRLQVETWSSEEVRINAAACILQVFKLKGADRKHKQDREKVQKRPITEQEKFSPQYDCTVLTDLSVDSIYIPPSRGISPVQSDGENGSNSMPRVSCIQSQVVKAGSVPPGELSPATSTPATTPAATAAWVSKTSTSSVCSLPPLDTKTWKIMLPHMATAETAAGWLAYNRYGQHVKTFANYDSRDLHRLSKEDIVQMIGLIDGVRLYNDLHMKPLAPRLTLYIAQKGDTVFHPILLQEVTVFEMMKIIAEIFEIPETLIHKITVSGPNKIVVRMTDDYLRYQVPDTAYHFHLIHEEGGEACTIHLQPVHHHLD